jgi:hypothetical protein
MPNYFPKSTKPIGPIKCQKIGIEMPTARLPNFLHFMAKPGTELAAVFSWPISSGFPLG